MGWGADSRTTMVSVVHICSDCKYLCFSPFRLIYTENATSTVTSMISLNCHWQKKSMLSTSYPIFLSASDDCACDGSLVLLATPKSNLECVHWGEWAGISLQELTGGNGYPSIDKFPGTLPPSSPPQICLASGFTPQPHQKYTEAG